MPYIESGRQKELLTEPERAVTEGDYNYLYTVAYLNWFIDSPSYATIHAIYKASIWPGSDLRVGVVESLLSKKGVSGSDLLAARALGFKEFYERIGKNYETYARVKNGDLPQFQRAEQAIINKFKSVEENLL